MRTQILRTAPRAHHSRGRLFDNLGAVACHMSAPGVRAQGFCTWQPHTTHQISACPNWIFGMRRVGWHVKRFPQIDVQLLSNSFGPQVRPRTLCRRRRSQTQRVLGTLMGNTYPNHKGNYYYRNHTLYHIGTLDPLGNCAPGRGSSQSMFPSQGVGPLLAQTVQPLQTRIHRFTIALSFSLYRKLFLEIAQCTAKPQTLIPK